MKEWPKLNQLRNFQAIIRYGSINAASQALFQTQPAMTRSIQELEKTLGVTLLVRGPQGMVLTKAGRVFESRVNVIVNDLERAIDELHQLGEVHQGSVVFGCSHLPAFSVLPALINKFQESNPAARITVVEGQLGELVASLRVGRLDFFIGISSPEVSTNEFKIESSIYAEFGVISRNGHPLANSQSLDELKGAKWYFPNSRTGYYKDLERLIFPDGKTKDDIIIYGDSVSIGEQLVLNEDYLIIAPKAILEMSYLADHISMIPIKEKLPDALYILLYRHQQGLTPLARKLMNEVGTTCFNMLEC